MTKTEQNQFAEMILIVGALKGQIEQLKVAPPAPAPQRPDTWFPRIDAVWFSRDIREVFEDRDAAFEYQKAQGRQENGKMLAVSQWFRDTDGVLRCAVY